MDRPLKQWLAGIKEGKAKIQKFEYLKNQKSFLDEIKHEGLSFEILGWCPTGPALPHVEKVPLALVGHPSSNGITIKMPYGADVLLRPASQPIFAYWVD